MFMLELITADVLLIIVFAIGYSAIILESAMHVNKTASALIMAVVTWMIVFLIKGHQVSEDVSHLGEKLNDVSQIIFFLMGAMALVEVIDIHKGFKIITDLIHTN